MKLVHDSTNYLGPVRVIAIDGPAGSGKTTLAQALAEKLRIKHSVEIVHMDDLYNGWQQDLIGELADRIENQILGLIAKNSPANFKTFDWAKGEFTNTQSISNPDFLILEGVGAANPKLKRHFALTIWVKAAQEVLLDRLIKRDGEQMRDELVKWQLHEAGYFNELAVREFADIEISAD